MKEYNVQDQLPSLDDECVDCWGTGDVELQGKWDYSTFL